VYCVFDLLYLDGYDLRRVQLEERKPLLERVLSGQRDPIRYSNHFIGHGSKFFRQAAKMGLEGIVSKRRDAPYVGSRNGDWLKIKAVQEEEFVIGGFTPPGTSGRQGFGALLLGYYNQQGDLIYAGRVVRASKTRCCDPC
jgi:bifunctional non-homologous end joining protein LigD